MSRSRLEKHEQEAGVRLLRTLGAKVYVLGTVRPQGDYRGTCQTPGLPDVQAFLPIRGDRSEATRRLLVWEVKRAQGGRLSEPQKEFLGLCAAAGVAHVVGPLDALLAWLHAEGYVHAGQVPHYRLPAAAPAISQGAPIP